MANDAKSLLIAYRKTLKCKRRDHCTPAELVERDARVERLARLREMLEPLNKSLFGDCDES